MSLIPPDTSVAWKTGLDLLRCVGCDGALVPAGEGLDCNGCGRNYPIRDGVLVVKDEPTADNRIARDFYNGPLWPKYRFWEWFFFLCNGGERRAREVILRHLPRQEGITLLDVAVGDGAYLRWLPASWSIVGIDISSAQLAACRRRNAGRDLRLILDEAESLPLRDHRFDAVLSTGGFNHFNDPEGALREMVRAARPGAPIVIADELPNVTDRMLLRKLGLPGLERWIVSRLMHLGDDFTDLVERHRDLDVAAVGRRVLKDCHYQPIWRGGCYLMVGQAP